MPLDEKTRNRIGDLVNQALVCADGADVYVRVGDVEFSTSGAHRSMRLVGPQSHDDDDGVDFYVIDMGDGILDVTRSRRRAFNGIGKLSDGARPLTRADIYKGRREIAECEYAHGFMCGGFPRSPDPNRPSEEKWMAMKPNPHEVDEFLSEKLFPREK